MFVYLVMYALPALCTLMVGAREEDVNQTPRVGMAVLLIAFAALIGLRYQVGTDWFNYQATVYQIYYTSFSGTFSYKDPGFGLLTWFSTRLGLGIYGVDVVCGSVLMYGLMRFARRQPDAWLAVTAAVPYLVIVVGMGYIRQAASIGFILLALIQFERRAYVRFAGWMVLATLFHGPSLILLPLVGLAIVRNRKELLIPLVVVGGILFAALISRRIDMLYHTYIEKEYDSSGAFIRLLMNAVPSLLFLLNRKRFVEDGDVRFFWTLVSLVSLVFFAVLPVFPSSTALDRVGLYLIPIQLLVFGRLPLVLGHTPQGARFVSYGVILYYGAVLVVWLHFATNAHAWIPYRFAPLAA